MVPESRTPTTSVNEKPQVDPLSGNRPVGPETTVGTAPPKQALASSSFWSSWVFMNVRAPFPARSSQQGNSAAQCSPSIGPSTVARLATTATSAPRIDLQEIARKGLAPLLKATSRTNAVTEAVLIAVMAKVEASAPSSRQLLQARPGAQGPLGSAQTLGYGMRATSRVVQLIQPGVPQEASNPRAARIRALALFFLGG